MVDIAVYFAEPLSLSDVKLDILDKLIDILQTVKIDLAVLKMAQLPLIMNVFA
jgi:hypothetical protein